MKNHGKNNLQAWNKYDIVIGVKRKLSYLITQVMYRTFK